MVDSKATVVFKQGNALLSSKSNATQATTASGKAVDLNDSVEVEDDMMDFLNDDSNF